MQWTNALEFFFLLDASASVRFSHMIIFFLKKCVQKIGNQFHELNEFRKIEIRSVSKTLAMIPENRTTLLEFRSFYINWFYDSKLWDIVDGAMFLTPSKDVLHIN